MQEELTVMGIVKNAISIGLKNAPSILGAVVLWILTIWIPYLNVGTTIAIVGMPAAMSRGEVMSPMEIFNAKYRKQMGEFFLVAAFVSIGVNVGTAFLLIPGISIGIAWMFAILLVIDKNRNPMAAIQESNDMTYGKKMTIFLGLLVMILAVVVPGFILVFIGMKIAQIVGLLFMLIMYVALFSIMIGANAYLYGNLTAAKE